MFEVKYKIWIENNGKIFGKGPYRLLQGVKEKGSLASSAKDMEMSYNKAFNLIKSIEKKLGFKLLVRKSGGVNGGGSSLTPEAEDLIKAYETFISECTENINKSFEKYFSSFFNKEKE